MARRNEHTKDQLKFLVLEAATEIIKTEGIAELSTRKIAKEIGYAPGTLYNIFKNSEDIILHINAQTMLEVMNIFTRQHNEKNLLILESIVIEYLNYIENNYQIWSCLFEYKKGEGEGLPEWYSETLDFILQAIQKYLPETTENKLEGAEFIWNCINGICFIGRTAANKNSDFSKIRNMCVHVINNF